MPWSGRAPGSALDPHLALPIAHLRRDAGPDLLVRQGRSQGEFQTGPGDEHLPASRICRPEWGDFQMPRALTWKSASCKCCVRPCGSTRVPAEAGSSEPSCRRRR